MKKLTFILLMAVSAKNFGQSDVNISNLASMDSEPYIAINPTNPNNIIAGWMRMRLDGLFDIATKFSFDGGENWSDIHFHPNDTVFKSSGDVTIIFNRTGIAYLNYVNCSISLEPDTSSTDPPMGEVVLSKSTDGGLSWSIPNKVIDYTYAPDIPIDRPWISIDNSAGINDGTVYITSMSFGYYSGQHHIYLRSTADGGSTWSNIKQIDDSLFSVGSMKASYAPISVGGDGKVYIAYLSYDPSISPFARFYIATTTDTGNTFQKYVFHNVFPSQTKVPAYTISADPVNNGHVILAWCDRRHGDLDVLFSKSTNGGQEWSDPIRINDDTLGNGIVQDQVWSAFSSTGELAIAWRDRRLNDTSSTSPFDIYTAVSLDGGDSLFLPNYRLSSSSHPSSALPCCNGFIGLALTDSIVVANWGGYNNSNSSWDHYFNKQDISTITTGMKENLLADNDFNLQVFPNPANSETIIQFTLPQRQFVELKLMNVRGEEIKSLIKNELIKGKHSITLDTKSLSPGIYFIKLILGKTAVVEKLIVNHATQK